MKKVIYLLVLCMVLGMAGCGTNQENKEPVSGNVSVEILEHLYGIKVCVCKACGGHLGKPQMRMPLRC